MAGTYSNVSNHPRILRLHEPGSLPPRIRIDKKTGFPVVEMPAGSEPVKTVEEAEEEEGESDYEGESHPSRGFPGSELTADSRPTGNDHSISSRDTCRAQGSEGRCEGGTTSAPPDEDCNQGGVRERDKAAEEDRF